MEIIEIIKNMVAALKTIPRHIFLVIFANGRASQYDMTFGINDRQLYLDRHPTLVKLRSSYFQRAFAYALVLYWIFLLLLLPVNFFLAGFNRLLATSVAIGIVCVFGSQIICNYVPKQFSDTLFEEHSELRRKETRKVKIVCFICEFMLIVNVFTRACLTELISKDALHIADFVGFIALFLIFGVPVVFLPIKYLYFNLKDINGTLCIHEMNIVHTVDLKYQDIIEKSNQQMYIYPIPEWRNPDISKAPAAYHVTLKAIKYIELGGNYLIYDFDRNKWVKLSNSPAIR